MNKPKLWIKDFIIITVANFLLYFTFYLLIATITSYATDKFYTSLSLAGLASGIFVIGVLITRVFTGRYINQVGLKKTLNIGFMLFLLTTCLYIPVNGIGYLLLVRFLNGAAMGIASTATGTIAATIIPNERHGEGLGYYALSLTIAAAIGPFIGITISAHSAFIVNFIVCIILQTLGLAAVSFVKVPAIEFAAERGESAKRFSFHRYFEINAISISSFALVIALCYSSILSFVSAYSKEIGLAAAGQFFFIVYAVFVLLSRPVTGHLFDSKDENYVMYPAIFMLAIGLFIVSQAHTGFMLLAGGAFVGVGYSTIASSIQPIAIKVSPKHRIELATSTSFIFQDLGMGLGPFILGGFVPLVGYRGLYIMMSGVVLICIVLYHFLHSRQNHWLVKPMDLNGGL